ncbi:hypothetical protein TNCT_252261 [Trichonephila clavata]|uniref:Uncharacterized protein n=1 Tax=Trichonephila clavata TaxID=2740835 RepID=A0A8X6JY60_TRICU|nr:hypothetical protein TNCT_252261 [Trichonephila clavata]
MLKKNSIIPRAIFENWLKFEDIIATGNEDCVASIPFLRALCDHWSSNPPLNSLEVFLWSSSAHEQRRNLSRLILSFSQDTSSTSHWMQDGGKKNILQDGHAQCNLFVLKGKASDFSRPAAFFRKARAADDNPGSVFSPFLFSNNFFSTRKRIMLFLNTAFIFNFLIS